MLPKLLMATALAAASCQADEGGSRGDGPAPQPDPQPQPPSAPCDGWQKTPDDEAFRSAAPAGRTARFLTDHPELLERSLSDALQVFETCWRPAVEAPQG